MASSKVTLDGLEDAVKGILAEYGKEVRDNLDVIVKDVTKKGVAALKSESRSAFGQSSRRKKKYANTWTSTFVTGRTSMQGTIYNTQAGLPHLLENGHVSRNGTGRTFGRVPGREHISKVEDELVRLIESEVKSRL